jgi:hypothetical protein
VNGCVAGGRNLGTATAVDQTQSPNEPLAFASFQGAGSAHATLLAERKGSEYTEVPGSRVNDEPLEQRAIVT